MGVGGGIRPPQVHRSELNAKDKAAILILSTLGEPNHQGVGNLPTEFIILLEMLYRCPRHRYDPL